MNTTISRLKLIFLALFAVGCAVIWTYQIFVVMPARQCDEQQRWWDPKHRVCATPLYIPSITGRPAGMSRKEWSEQQAARQAEREREGYPTTEEAAPPVKASAAPAAPAKK